MGKITLDDFKKIELRIAKIKKAEAVENSDKLLKILLEVGEEERQIVAGIAQYYKPDLLVGKKVVLVYNLEPKFIKGIESNGMILAAQEKEKVVLLTVDDDVDSGAKVS